MECRMENEHVEGPRKGTSWLTRETCQGQDPVNGGQVEQWFYSISPPIGVGNFGEEIGIN